MLERWRVYQYKRFPLVRNGLLTAGFSSATITHSLELRDAVAAQPNTVSPTQTVGAALIAFLVVFLVALQFHIVTELRAANADRLHSSAPNRAVTLKELELVGMATAAVQFGLTLSLGHFSLVLILVLIWGYLGLISQSFFVSDWLNTHPLSESLARAGLAPLVALYATGCDWLLAQSAPPKGISWFLLVSLFSALAINIGQKLCALEKERNLKTYSALWGRERAVILWLGVLWLLSMSSLLAGVQLQHPLAIALVLLLLLTGSVLMAWRFVSQPKPWAPFQLMTTVWVLSVYLTLGIVPFVLQT